MNALIIGGNRFLGLELTFRLLAQGHRITLLNRGNLPDPFGHAVERITCDRDTTQFDAALEGRSYDAVIDFALFDRKAAERTVRVLSGRAGHYLMVSTGQVYLVRTNYVPPAREVDYEGALLAPPPSGYDLEQWHYGCDKRAAEDLIAESDLPATRIRIPMVHGGRDYHRRVESILRRVLDRGPLLVANAQALCRHVYGPAVIRAIETILRHPATNDAYNFCQNETLTVRDFVARIASHLGANPEVISTTDVAELALGLDPMLACPFSGRWMSCIDDQKAREKLGLVHEPVDVYLPAVIEALLARWPTDLPPSMAQRPQELELASRLRS